MKSILNYFLFFLYLIAAELPLFVIFLIRTDSSSDLYLYIKVLLLISILLNALILIVLLCHKPIEKFNEIIVETDNKIGRNSISDFFTFFLLPFFTFSINDSANPLKFLLELALLFLLLTIYLFRTNNLTANILIFLLFNIYEVKTKGNHFTLLCYAPNHIDSFDPSKNILKISRKYYIYIGDKYKTFKNIIISLILLFLISLGLFFYFL